MKPQALLSRIVKGTMVVGWIFFLLLAAVLAWSQRATKALDNAADFITTGEHVADAGFPGSGRWSPQEYLAIFLGSYGDDPPPVASVLNQITDPRWDNVTFYFDSIAVERWGATSDTEDKLRREYFSLFGHVANTLLSIAANIKANPADAPIISDDLPEFFRPNTYEVVTERNAIVGWVERQRDRLKLKGRQFSLANTFLLLLVLGALGSTIFLIRDFIKIDQTTTISAYVFRPVLGMFLAMALFVVDIFTHSVISTASLVEIRKEPLLLLAFAAGLLSEQAYTVIEARTRAALRRYKERLEAEEGK